MGGYNVAEAKHRLPSLIDKAIEGMLRRPDDDLEWSRPYLEKAEASPACGEGIAGDEFFAQLNRRFDALR